MGFPRSHTVLHAGVFAGSFLLALSLSLPSTTDTTEQPTDWIERVYASFDSLATDIHDYAWPTDAGTVLTSGFGDFRQSHFHAGIDISTHGRTGYRVNASRKGWVSRISVDPFGYGKMIELAHEDGYVTLYAHLKGFRSNIEAYVRDVQKRTGSYSVELTPAPDQFPVEKESLIAYSGDTGIGAPHLHFEIRDSRKNPINPLRMPSLTRLVHDDVPPAVAAIAVVPLDHATRINGDYRPRLVRVRQVSPRLYIAADVIHASGTFGLGVRTSDRHNASWHRFGTHTVRASLDDSLLYSSAMGQLLIGSGREVALHYDWPMVLNGNGRIQRLFIEHGNRLPIYARLPEGSGIIRSADGSPGHHTLSVTVTDIHGNQAELRAVVAFDDPPAIDVRHSAPDLVTVPYPGAHVESIGVPRRRGGSSRWTTQTLPTRDIADADGVLRIPIPENPAGLVKVSALGPAGVSSHPHFVVPMVPRATETSLTIEKEFLRNYVYVRVSSHLPFTLRPSLWLRQGEERWPLALNALNERAYVATLPLSMLKQHGLRLEAEGVVNGADVHALDENPVVPITPALGGIVESDDGQLSLTFPGDAVYDTLYCRIERTESGYSLFPNDVLLKKAVTVAYRLPPELPNDRAGLFGAGGGEQSLMSRTFDETRRAFVGRFHRFLGDVAVLTDTLPPWISGLSVTYRRGVLRSRASIGDERSGIDPHRIRLWIDDDPLIPEYNPYDHHLQIEEVLPLAPGIHRLKLVIRDRMDNTASASTFVRVGKP